MEKQTKKLSLEPYKGTRDFYPQDQFIQNYIFSVWRKVVQSYGYLEYGASILEETELYRAKSGEEIVNEQTYSFKDRGDRDVTIRPEMTPTVARMVAQKRKELTFPLRWFSIPNLFRYERPQRGRLREHWQLNVDMFGVDSIEADVEVISMAYDIMKKFGAQDETFEIRINSRKLTEFVFKSKDALSLDDESAHKLMKLVDRIDKMDQTEFHKQANVLLGEKSNHYALLTNIFSSENPKELSQFISGSDVIKNLDNLIIKLNECGIKNVILKPSLMRGFDYYTGTIFEMYDTNPANPRALFGGGRYDDLVGIFGVEKVPGIGFGMGDVTIRDFLETYNLLPEYKSAVDLYIAPFEASFIGFAEDLAKELRMQGVNVAVDFTDRKVAAKVKTADKEKIPWVVVVGEEEQKSDNFKIKNLKESKEYPVSRKEIMSFLKQGIK